MTLCICQNTQNHTPQMNVLIKQTNKQNMLGFPDGMQTLTNESNYITDM